MAHQEGVNFSHFILFVLKEKNLLFRVELSALPLIKKGISISTLKNLKQPHMYGRTINMFQIYLKQVISTHQVKILLRNHSFN